MKIKMKNNIVSNSFYFQARESPAPLNIPLPTPAPDWGGPVACLSGPKFFWRIFETILNGDLTSLY